MAAHYSTLAWKIPWMEEPGRLQSMGSRRVGHGWVTSLSLFTFHFYALEKKMATHSSVPAWRIPGMGSHRIGHDWSDLAVAVTRTYMRFQQKQEMTLHIDITRWSTPKSDWLYSLHRRWKSSIHWVKTRPGADCGSDNELLIAKFRLKMKKVGKTTRPFRYDLIKPLMIIQCKWQIDSRD